MAERAMRDFDATYVGESGGRHFDRVPGESVGDYLLRNVSEMRRQCYSAIAIGRT
jgi:hypothetical protein